MSLSITWGFVAGFVATIVMTVIMLPLMRMGPSIMAMVASRAMGGEPGDSRNMMGGIIFHLIYGTLMGGIFAWGSDALITIVNPLVNGLLFGILLFIIMVVIVMPLARAPMPPMMMAGIFLTIHLIYGAVLGSVAAWLSGMAIL